jgi:SNF2 family DNA or RNA helicase
MKALAMMTEKERGVVEGANFKTLWEVSTSLDGQIRYGSSSEQLTASNVAGLIISAIDTLLREELKARVLLFFSADY